jgi:ATP-dependent DNA helicase RecG
VLLGEPPSEDGEQRLEALVSTTDGFALAEIDLEMRGEGTLLGSRQRGRSDLVLAKLKSDQDLLESAHEMAASMVAAGGDVLEAMEDELRLFVDEDEATYLFKS